MTNGRAAWNVVTSMNDGEALNMGKLSHGEHDSRYDRADEFMEVVLGHWDSWEDDAIAADKATGLFAHPDKVHRLDYEGEYFRSRGPFTVPRSAQGHPVIIQAGQSGRGRRFAARWAELVFVDYHNLASAKEDYATFKAAGRRRRPRPGQGVRRRRRLPVVARDPRRGGGQGRADRQAAEGDRPAFLALRSAERRSLEEADRRTVDRGGDPRPGPARRACATASIACWASAIRRRATSWR